MKRLGALVAAVLLVLAAVWVRGRLGDGGITLGRDLAGKLTCSTELVAACVRFQESNPGIKMTLEPAGKTAERLMAEGTDDPGFDAWLAAEPYATILASTRSQANRPRILSDPGDVLAHSRVAFYIHNTRAEALKAHCGGTIGWECVMSASAAASWGDIGGEPTWGPFKPFIGTPVDAGPLVGLGGAATAVLGPKPDALAVRDEGFVSRLTSLAGADRTDVNDSLNALTRMLTAGPAFTDLVATIEVHGAQHAESGLLSQRVVVVWPEPVVTTEVVALGRQGSEAGERLVEALRGGDFKGLLKDTGWREGPTPSSDSNLPSTAALITLRQLWDEISR